MPKVTQCLGHAVSPRASRLHPSPGPRLQPLRRTRPPVAALASGAASQAAARVRSNSLEPRLAGKPRRWEPANLQGRRGLRRASQPQAPFVSSRLSEHQKSTPDSILSPFLARARSRSAHTWERLTVEAPTEGKGVHPGRTQRHRQVALREIPERLLNPKSLRAS